MTSQLCLLGCHNFHKEVSAAIEVEGWDDVVAVAFPARCGRPGLSWEELRPLLPEGCSQVAIMGRACTTDLAEPPDDFPPTRLLQQEQCFHLVANPELVDEAITGGGYLITPTWLIDWKEHLEQMGFIENQANDFFHDFAKELVLLDTGVEGDCIPHFTELKAAINLPVRRVPVGLDHIRGLISHLVLEWRQEGLRQELRQQARNHSAELADHKSAMDMLSRLAKSQHEDEAIAAIGELFQMLFAPKSVYYLRVERDIATPQGQIPPELRHSMDELMSDYDWTPDGQGFLLKIVHGDTLLGKVAVHCLAFPDQRERYLNMALAVVGVCGLAIDNARNRRRLLEAEKMASLGYLVAGVAHEINTPLGVGLAAASTLQERSHDLASRFADRSMTKSDLNDFLGTATSSTRLINDNLQRIGQLINSFRQVAVEGESPLKQRVNIKDCIEQVIQSLGERLSADRYMVNINCEPTVEIESFSSDWVTIFANLIGNSLKHGFKGREQGSIDIQVGIDNKHLQVEYRDDGVGMADEVLARLFEPFFTTNLQQGMGLGMHLVYNLISQRLRGTILCDSEPGRGVRFFIEAPLEEAA